MLKGKAKELFEKWYKLKNINFRCQSNAEGDIELYNIQIELFYDMPDSMQYGVLVDFFDSVGIYVSNNHNIDLYCSKLDGAYYKIDYNNNEGMPTIVMNKFKTRPEARTKAIEKAVEILNERK